MFQRKRSALAVLALTAVALVGWTAPAAASSAQQDPGFEVVAAGLNNPRGLAPTFTGDGLLVAEAGVGGAGPCFVGPEGEVCLGNTGAIAQIDLENGEVERVVTGLPSLAGEGGAGATGPHDVVAFGSGLHYITMGLGGNLATRAGLGAEGTLLGTLIRVYDNRTPKVIADLAAFEEANNPDGSDPAADSNPYSMVRRDNQLFIADAGANALIAVRGGGKLLDAKAVFPPRLVPGPVPGSQIPMQSVPNAVAFGRDNTFYVGELTGFPFPVGGARVYRINRDGEPEIYAAGFTNIIDIAFDSQGDLYVLELAKNSLLDPGGPPAGRLIRVDRVDQSQTVIAEEGLIAPTSVLIIGRDAYVANLGLFPGQGQIVRISLRGE